MKQVTDLHRQAMELADQADAALRGGDDAVAQMLFRDAFIRERQAAEQMIPQMDAEPTRSVLLRSAASLALQCHEYREAERLVATALSGDPPEELCHELRALLHQLYSESDLREVVS